LDGIPLFFVSGVCDDDGMNIPIADMAKRIDGDTMFLRNFIDSIMASGILVIGIPGSSIMDCILDPLLTFDKEATIP